MYEHSRTRQQRGHIVSVSQPPNPRRRLGALAGHRHIKRAAAVPQNLRGFGQNGVSFVVNPGTDRKHIRRIRRGEDRGRMFGASVDDHNPVVGHTGRPKRARHRV